MNEPTCRVSRLNRNMTLRKICRNAELSEIAEVVVVLVFCNELSEKQSRSTRCVDDGRE